MEALERLLLQQFEERQQRARSISKDTANLLHALAQSPCKETLDKAENSNDFRAYSNKYQEFRAAIRNGDYGKTADFWLKYVHGHCSNDPSIEQSN